jgi:hypothetical protein
MAGEEVEMEQIGLGSSAVERRDALRRERFGHRDKQRWPTPPATIQTWRPLAA